MADVTAAGTRPATYTVQRGDTLTKLGERFGMAWKEIWQANRDAIPNPDLIRVGQELKIPGGSGGSGPADAGQGAAQTDGGRANATTDKKKNSTKSDKPANGAAVGSGANGPAAAPVGPGSLPQDQSKHNPIVALVQAAQLPGVTTMDVTVDIGGRTTLVSVPADMTSARVIAMEEARSQTRRGMLERQHRINYFLPQVNDFSLPMSQRESAHYIVQTARMEMLQLYNSWMRDTAAIANSLRELGESLKEQQAARDQAPAGPAAEANGEASEPSPAADG